MARTRTIHDLTLEELCDLIIEKRRSAREARLDEFARTGKISFIRQPQPTKRINSYRNRSIRTPEIVLDRPARTESRQRTWVDRLLIVVEVLAVIGLVIMVAYGALQVRNLNKEASSSSILATLTPTPLLSAVVLPSGHTPPQTTGGAQPNEAEIPVHLRPLVTSIAELPLPTSSPQQTIRIKIPTINVDNSVIQGDGWEQLMRGVGQHNGTPDPGKDGNIVLSAHNDIYGEIFKNLDQLQPGDEVILFTSQRSYTYIVQQTQIVEPTRVDVMQSTREPIVTLISCYPYLVDDQRIVVTALLQE